MDFETKCSNVIVNVVIVNVVIVNVVIVNVVILNVVIVNVVNVNVQSNRNCSIYFEQLQFGLKRTINICQLLGKCFL